MTKSHTKNKTTKKSFKNSSSKNSKQKVRERIFKKTLQETAFSIVVRQPLRYFLRSAAPPKEVIVQLMPQMIRVAEEPKIPEGLKGYCLRYGKYLRVSVQGRSFFLFVDSGSSNVFITKQQAKELGILTGKEEWWRTRIEMIDKVDIPKKTIINDVEFTLSDGKVLVSDICILDCEDLPPLGGACLLKKYRCLQKFRRDGTSWLYFRSEGERNQKEEKKKVIHEYCLKGHLRQDLKETPLKIKIDTGTSKTVLSELFMKKLAKLQGYRAISGCPSNVKILAEDGLAVVETSSVSLLENPGDDFCIGRDIFFRYEALIDYENNLIFFNIGKNTFKAEHLDGISGFKQVK